MATAPNLLISASFAASGAYAQVSQDISNRLEASSHQPISLLSAAFAEQQRDADHDAHDDSSMEDDDDNSIVFEPRIKDDDGGCLDVFGIDNDNGDLFAPRLKALSPSSLSSTTNSQDGDSSSTPPFLQSATDSLVQCFSNIQIVSPKFFQQRQTPFSQKETQQVVTPEELTAKGCYLNSTRSQSSRSSRTASVSFFGSDTKQGSTSASSTTTITPSKRKSLADMVHSVDPSLFSKPLQRMGESPVLARMGNFLTNTTTTSLSSSPNHFNNNTTMNESFHTCLMTEDSILPSTATKVSLQQHRNTSRLYQDDYNVSPTRKRKAIDNTMLSNSETESTNTSIRSLMESLLSPEERTSATTQRSKTSFSFQSSRHPNRVIYRLREGKKGMSEQSKEVLNTFLPRMFHLGKKPEPKNSGTSSSSSSRQMLRQQQQLRKKATPPPPPNETPKVKNSSQKQQYVESSSIPNKIYVLLLEIPHKLFEICPVDYVRDMTVGDVLTKVRTNASDPVLAAQSYKSLINAHTEFSAPMLPIGLLLSKDDPKPLLTALPPNASATECRHIQQILMNHPSLQKLWDKDDPFEPSPAKRQRRH